MQNCFKLLLLPTCLFLGSLASGQTVPQAMVVEGRLYGADGAPLDDASVNIRFEVIEPRTSGPSCVLYRETHTAVNVSSTDQTSRGIFAIPLGSSATPDFPGAGLTSIFTGDTVSGDGCASTGANRSLVIHVLKTGASIYETLSPPTQLLSVPSAMVAQNANNAVNATNATKLGGLDASAFLKSSPSTVQQITNVATPTAGSDAANKTYVDSYLGGKTLDLTGVAPGSGGGKTVTWDSVAGKWVAGLADADRLQGKFVSTTTPTTEQVLKWNGSAWAPAADAGMTTLTGEVSASGSGSVAVTLNARAVSNAKIANGAIDSRTIASGYQSNRILVTDSLGGSNLVYKECLNDNEVLKWSTATGWSCGAVVSLDANSRLPAADGFQLTNVNASKLQGNPVSTTAPTTNQVLAWSGSQWQPMATGTVTSVSIVSANGLIGTVSTASTTPAITLSTSVNGMAKGNGTAFSAATVGTDYSAGTSALATGILKSTTSTGVLSIAGASDITSALGYTPVDRAGLTSGQIWVGNTNSAATAVSVSGDGGLSNTGVLTITKVNGVSYPSSASNATFPVVTSTNTVTYKSMSADNFTQYAYLYGRTGGQTLIGGTAANESLTQDSTADSSKGNIIISPNGGFVGVGTNNPATALHVTGHNPSVNGGINNEVARFEGVGVFRQNTSGSPIGLVLANSNGVGSTMEFRGISGSTEKALARITSGQDAGGSGRLMFITDKGGTLLETMVLEPAGDTTGTNAGARLSVAGKVQARDRFEGPGVKTLIATQTITAGTDNIGWQSIFTSDFKFYEITFEDVYGVGGPGQLIFWIYTKTYPNWYYMTFYASSSSTGSNPPNDGKFYLSTSLNYTSFNPGAYGSIVVSNPSATGSFKLFTSNVSWTANDGSPFAQRTAASWRGSTESITGFAIQAFDSNAPLQIRSIIGTVKVYGWN